MIISCGIQVEPIIENHASNIEIEIMLFDPLYLRYDFLHDFYVILHAIFQEVSQNKVLVKANNCNVSM